MNTQTSAARPLASVPPTSTVGAQSMLDARMEPPPVPATSDPKEVTPETGELSSTQADATDDTAEQDRPTNRPVPGVTHIIQLRPARFAFR